MNNTVFFRSGTGKCPNCGDFGVSTGEAKECPSCSTRFNEYVVLSEGDDVQPVNN